MKLLEIIAEKSKKNIILETGLPRGFRRGEGIVQVANDRWLFVFNNANENLAFAYPTEQAANAAMNEYNDPNTDKNTWLQNNESNKRTSRWRGAVDAVDEANLNARINQAPQGSWLKTLASKVFFRPFVALMRIAGPLSGIYFGIINAAADVHEEFEDGQISAEQRDEELSVLYGMFYVEVGAVLLFIFTTARLARQAVSALRVITRLPSAALAATGVGIPAAIVTFVVSEAAWWAFSYWITSARVQNALKDAILGIGAGFIFEGIGNLGQGAMAALAEATNDRFGSRDARRWLGFPGAPGEEEIRSASYGSSEWAKLVIGAIMYPPRAEPILVPYYNEDARQSFLAEKLNISVPDTETQPTDAAEPDTNPADEQEPYDDAPMRIVRQQQAAQARQTAAADQQVQATRNREQSLANTDYYNNPSWTRAEPFTGAR
jgi:hypothetical protein